MSTPTSRAAWLRGALVGTCAAGITTAAHAYAGGAMPQGGSLLVALVVCGTAGAVTGTVSLGGRRARLLGIVIALCIAQFLGHLTLSMTAGHHHGGGLGLTTSMVTAHVAAAIVLGAAIAAAEYLYVIGTSVLGWLRLFATASPPTIACQPMPRAASVPAVQRVLLRTGLSLRAPPWGTSSPA